MVSTVIHDPAITDASKVISQIPEPVLRDEEAPDSGGKQTACWLARRLALAMCDLGLSEILPNYSAAPTAEGLSFRSLTLRQADQLVRALEDLARHHEPKRPVPGPGQLSLFENGS
jgi:hypothetical protein